MSDNNLGKIISLFSNKGGVGKSTIAVNLATCLASGGKNRVALVDLDLMSGDIAIMMDVNPKGTIVDVMRDISSIDHEIIDDYMLRHETQIMVLPAPITPEQGEFISAGCVDKVMSSLAKKYDYVIVDTGPNFGDVNLAVLDHSSKIFYVTALDIPTVKNTRVGLDIMRRLNYDDDRIEVLLNRYTRKYGVSMKDVENTLKKKISRILPMDEATVVISSNRGEPFVIKHGNKAISKGIIEIASSLKGGDSK